MQVRFSGSNYTKMCMRPGLRPDPTEGITELPRPSSWFSGSHVSRQGWEGEKGEKEEK